MGDTSCRRAWWKNASCRWFPWPRRWPYHGRCIDIDRCCEGVGGESAGLRVWFGWKCAVDCRRRGFCALMEPRARGSLGVFAAHSERRILPRSFFYLFRLELDSCRAFANSVGNMLLVYACVGLWLVTWVCDVVSVSLYVFSRDVGPEFVLFTYPLSGVWACFLTCPRSSVYSHCRLHCMSLASWQIIYTWVFMSPRHTLVWWQII